MSGQGDDQSPQATKRKPWILNDRPFRRIEEAKALDDVVHKRRGSSTPENSIEHPILFLKQWNFGFDELHLFARNLVRVKLENGEEYLSADEDHFYILNIWLSGAHERNAGARKVSLSITPEEAVVWILHGVVTKEIRKELRIIKWLLLIPCAALSWGLWNALTS